MIRISRRHRNGFTMIELLVTMVILVILAGIVGMNVTASQQKARDARRKSDLVNISKALELYYNDLERYPASAGGQISGAAWGNPLQNGTIIYMAQLPQDPKAYGYFYEADAGGSEYRLYARLENPRDMDLHVSGGAVQTYTGTNCGSSECSYGISSSNTSPTDNGHSLH